MKLDGSGRGRTEDVFDQDLVWLDRHLGFAEQAEDLEDSLLSTRLLPLSQRHQGLAPLDREMAAWDLIDGVAEKLPDGVEENIVLSHIRGQAKSLPAPVRIQPICVHQQLAAIVRVSVERMETQTAGVDECGVNVLGVGAPAKASPEKVVAPRCKRTGPGRAKLGFLETPPLLLVCRAD